MIQGEKIRMIRLRNNITVAEMSQRLNCSTNTIHNYETGRTFPKGEKLKKICNILEVEPHELNNDEESIDNTCKDRIMKNAKTIGNLIKFYRKQERMTQKELAGILDIDQSYVSKIETGNMDIFAKDNESIKENILELFPKMEGEFNMENNKIVDLCNDKNRRIQEVISQYLKEHKMTTEQLSLEIGASKGFIYSIISGNRNLTTSREKSIKLVAKLGKLIPEIDNMFRGEIDAYNMKQIKSMHESKQVIEETVFKNNKTEDFDCDINTEDKLDIFDELGSDYSRIVKTCLVKMISSEIDNIGKSDNIDDVYQLLDWCDKYIINSDILRLKFENKIDEIMNRNMPAHELMIRNPQFTAAGLGFSKDIKNE